MKKSVVRASGIACVVFVGMLFSYVQVGLAGWSGGMNGVGYGQASVNVRAFETSANKIKTATTPNMTNPSVAMTITSGYVFGSTLPADASQATVAKVKAGAGYIWLADTVGSNGDSTDDAELEGRIRITAADCASLTMNSSSVIDETKKTGTLTVNVLGTAGTAIWMRGFELPAGLFPPQDDPTTSTNEFINFLKVYGTLKWDVLNVGPMNQNTNDCTAINIPFSYETHITNLYSVSQGVAKSLPLVIECPTDIVVTCNQSVKYPETVLVGGCGNITISFNPPPLTNGAGSIVPFPPGSFPPGTNLVTVTATDKDANTASCTFKVVVTGLTFKGFYSPVGTANNTTNNAVSRKAGSSFPLKWDMLCGTFPITSGTPPTVNIQKVLPSVGPVTTLNAEYQNDWHINWPTPSTTKNDIYKATVNLPDGSTAVLFVKFN